MPKYTKRNRRPLNAREQWKPDLVTYGQPIVGGTPAAPTVRLGLNAPVFGGPEIVPAELFVIDTTYQPISSTIEVTGEEIVWTFPAVTAATDGLFRIPAWLPQVRTENGGYLAPAVWDITTPA